MKNINKFMGFFPINYLTLLMILTFVAASLFCVVVAISVSPLYVSRSLDSDIFKNIGYAISIGKIPYVDLFDHKGPLIHFINYWGLIFNEAYGILILMIINLALFLYSICRVGIVLGLKWLGCLFVVVFTLLALMRFFDGGNYSEDWSLAAISFPYLWYIESLVCKNGNISLHKCFLIGVLSSLVFLLRANNCAPILGLVICWFVLMIKQNDWKVLWSSMLLILCGFLIPICFICIYYYLKAGTTGIYEMFYGSILYNLNYLNFHKAPNRGSMLIYIFPIIISVAFLWIGKKQTYLRLSIPLTISFILTLLTTGKSYYPHYLTIVVPLMSLSMVILILRKKFFICTLFLLLSARLCTASIGLCVQQKEISKENLFFRENFKSIILSIPLQERDSVWNGASSVAVDAFTYAHFVPCNQIYLPFQMDYSERLRLNEKNNIFKVEPLWIILPYENLEEDNILKTESFLEKYDSISCTKSTQRKNVVFWRRRD